MIYGILVPKPETESLLTEKLQSANQTTREFPKV